MFVTEIYGWEDSVLPTISPIAALPLSQDEVVAWTGRTCALWRCPLPVLKFSKKDTSSWCFFEENTIEYSARRPLPVSEVIHEVSHLVSFQETLEEEDGHHSRLFLGTYLTSLSHLLTLDLKMLVRSLSKELPKVALPLLYPSTKPKVSAARQIAAIEALRASLVYRDLVSS